MFQTERQAKGGKDVTVNFAWQERYAAAMLELKREELPQRRKLFINESKSYKDAGASSAEELWAINDALRALRALAKTECPPQRSPQTGGPQSEAAS